MKLWRSQKRCLTLRNATIGLATSILVSVPAFATPLKPCELKFGGVPYYFDYGKIYHLRAARYSREDHADANALKEKIIAKANFLNQDAINELLAFAFENATGHGTPSGEVSEVRWGLKFSDTSIQVSILNSLHHKLPATLSERTFLSTDPIKTYLDDSFVPVQERDLERGAYGQGLARMLIDLHYLYLDDLKTQKVAWFNFREVEDPSDAESPRKVLFELEIPFPEPEALTRREIAVRNRTLEKSAKEAEENQIRKTLDALRPREVDEPTIPSAQKEAALALAMKLLRDLIVGDPEAPDSYYVAPKLGDAGAFARPAKALLRQYAEIHPEEKRHVLKALEKIGFEDEDIPTLKIVFTAALQSGSKTDVSFSIDYLSAFPLETWKSLKPALFDAIQMHPNIAYDCASLIQRIGIEREDFDRIRALLQDIVSRLTPESKKAPSLHEVLKITRILIPLLSPSQKQLVHDQLLAMLNVSDQVYEICVTLKPLVDLSDLPRLRSILKNFDRDEHSIKELIQSLSNKKTPPP